MAAHRIPLHLESGPFIRCSCWFHWTSSCLSPNFLCSYVPVRLKERLDPSLLSKLWCLQHWHCRGDSSLQRILVLSRKATSRYATLWWITFKRGMQRQPQVGVKVLRIKGCRPETCRIKLLTFALRCFSQPSLPPSFSWSPSRGHNRLLDAPSPKNTRSIFTLSLMISAQNFLSLHAHRGSLRNLTYLSKFHSSIIVAP